jgi:hypothetical protein
MWRKRISLVITASMILISIAGCGVGARVRGENIIWELSDRNFAGLKPPEVEIIKKDGKSSSFPYLTFDEVWRSTLVILVQQSILVYSSMEEGTILSIFTPPLGYDQNKRLIPAPSKRDMKHDYDVSGENVPLAVYVEKSEPVNVYIYYNPDFGKLTFYKEIVIVGFANLYEKQIGSSTDITDKYYFKLNVPRSELWQQFSTKFFDKLSTQAYASKKWKYLSNAQPE